MELSENAAPAVEEYKGQQLALNDTNFNAAQSVNQRQVAIYRSAIAHPSSRQPVGLTNAYLLLSLMPKVRLYSTRS